MVLRKFPWLGNVIIHEWRLVCHRNAGFILCKAIILWQLSAVGELNRLSCSAYIFQLTYQVFFAHRAVQLTWRINFVDRVLEQELGQIFLSWCHHWSADWTWLQWRLNLGPQIISLRKIKELGTFTRFHGKCRIVKILWVHHPHCGWLSLKIVQINLHVDLLFLNIFGTLYLRRWGWAWQRWLFIQKMPLIFRNYFLDCLPEIIKFLSFYSNLMLLHDIQVFLERQRKIWVFTHYMLLWLLLAPPIGFDFCDGKLITLFRVDD